MKSFEVRNSNEKQTMIQEIKCDTSQNEEFWSEEF